MSDWRTVNKQVRAKLSEAKTLLTDRQAIEFLVDHSDATPIPHAFFVSPFRQLTGCDPTRSPYSVMKSYYSQYLDIHASRFGVSLRLGTPRARTKATQGVIYEIRHRSGRAYIGKSVGVESRWRAHVKQLAEGKHPSSRLQYLYDRCGLSAFDFQIVETVVEHELGTLSVLLDKAERAHMLAAGARKLNAIFPGEGRLRELDTLSGSGLLDDLMNEIARRNPDRRLRPAQFRRQFGDLAGFDYSSPHPTLLKWYRLWTGRAVLENQPTLIISVGSSEERVPLAIPGFAFRRPDWVAKSHV